MHRAKSRGTMQTTVPTSAPRTRPSFDQLYARIRGLGEGVTGQILEPGVVSTMSRPGVPHARSQSLIDHWLQQYDRLRGGKGWWILREMEVRLPGDLLAVPDIAGWRVERVPRLPEENPLTVIPDWCCEVLSPSTARPDRVLKLPLYAQAGVQWILARRAGGGLRRGVRVRRRAAHARRERVGRGARPAAAVRGRGARGVVVAAG